METMRVLGFLLILAGIIGIIVTFSIDTSVESMDGSRVNNLGKIADREIAAILSCGALISGILLDGFAFAAGAIIEAIKGQGEAIKGQGAKKPAASQPLPVAEAIFENDPVVRERERQKQLDREAKLNSLREKWAQDREAARERHRKARATVWNVVSTAPAKFDGALRELAGNENVILHNFLRLVVYLMLPVVAVTAIWVLRG